MATEISSENQRGQSTMRVLLHLNLAIKNLKTDLNYKQTMAVALFLSFLFNRIPLKKGDFGLRKCRRNFGALSLVEKGRDI